MLKKLKLMTLSLAYMLALALPGALAVGAGTSYAATTTPPEQQQINDNLCKGSNLDLSSTAANNCNDQANAGQSVTDIIKKVINILSVLIGAIAVVMIIIGGFRYVTSAGNAEGTKAARNTILYALVGLVVVALAQIIVHFVLNSVANP
jgi:hypothetical protein